MSLLFVYCNAGGYGGGGGGYGGGGYGGGGHGGFGGGGYGGGGYGGGGFGGFGGFGGGFVSGGGGGGGIVPAAIISRHRIDYRDVPSQGVVAPTTIEVGSSSVPLNILFRSSSSHINVQQAHEGAGGSVQQSSSVDEPHHLFHEVSKPIIQEVREVISPYRRIVQEINPVQEDIQTIVARGTGGGVGVGGGAGFGGGFGGFGRGGGGYGGGGFGGGGKYGGGGYGGGGRGYGGGGYGGGGKKY